MEITTQAAREDILTIIRQEAQVRGASWLFAMLSRAGVEKLSDMTDDQLGAVLAGLPS